MNQPKELEWNRMFALDLPAVRPAKNPHECCDACKEAKEVKCVCACGGKNHGAALKKNVAPLEKMLGLENVDSLSTFQEKPWLEIC
jgi:hypothetical protein